MPITHTNFRGDVYYLHSRKTKKGKNTYYFAKKSTGNLVEKLPSGYEIYEAPNGMVYFRKPLKKLFTDEEIRLVEKAMKQYCPIKDFKLDVREEFIYIYTVANNLEDLPNALSLLMDEKALAKVKDYKTDMRFELLDSEKRIFGVDRFCYLGGIDDWMDLDSSTNLEALVAEYVSHLGQESFYDLI